MARRELRETVDQPSAKPASDQQLEENRKRLSDPAYQAEVMAEPKTYRCQLFIPRIIEEEVIEDGKRVLRRVEEIEEREILINYQLTLSDTLRRQIADEVASYCIAVRANMLKENPELRNNGALLLKNMDFLEAAMEKKKEELRLIISQLAVFVNTDPSKGIERPSVEDIAVGMDDDDMMLFGTKLYLDFVQKKIERQQRKAERVKASA